MTRNQKTDTNRVISQADLQLIADIPFWSHVPADLLEMLLKDATVASHPRPGLLFNHNDPADHIYVLLEGMVTISLYHEDGTQVVIETITPVRAFAEAAAFLQGHYPATGEYSAGTRILAVPMVQFLNRLETSPQTARSILGALALRERELSAQLDAFQLPDFEKLYADFQKAGIDKIYCLSVNDSFVMNKWGQSQDLKNIELIPDGSGEFTRKMGMLVNKDNLGFGMRSWRYGAVVDNGVVTSWFEEPGFADNFADDPYEVSSPQNILKSLNA